MGNDKDHPLVIIVGMIMAVILITWGIWGDF